MATTIEWFGGTDAAVNEVGISLTYYQGATTYRMKTNGLTIFLDTWIKRPSVLPKFLDLEDITEVDYIFISHAHFDHLPGADVIAKKTGALVIANGEAIHVLRQAGVPESQLFPVQGGERIPLFTKEVRDGATHGSINREPGLPDAPHRPATQLACMSVQVWPSLHCLMPKIPHDQLPEIMDTGVEYHGLATPYTCTLDVTFGMKFGLLRIGELMPKEEQNEGVRSFAEYVSDRTNVFSHCDGGQLAFNFLVAQNKTLLWSAHLGGYDGIFKSMDPKPDVAILGIAGRANLNGRPFDGSAAQFARDQVRWLGEPKTVIWSLHDQAPMKPFSIDTTAAKRLVEQETSSRTLDLVHAKPTTLFA